MHSALLYIWNVLDSVSFLIEFAFEVAFELCKCGNNSTVTFQKVTIWSSLHLTFLAPKMSIVMMAKSSLFEYCVNIIVSAKSDDLAIVIFT